MLLLRRQREEQEHRHEVAERLREERTDEPEAEDQTSNERTLRRE